jgi:hypothetical protein
MPGMERSGRRVAGRPAYEAARDKRVVCPRCEAAIGWSCTKKLGDQVLPRRTVHPERKEAARR